MIYNLEWREHINNVSYLSQRSTFKHYRLRPRVRACKRPVGTPFPAGVTSTGLPGPPELLGLVFESSSLAVVGPSTVALISEASSN